VDLETRIAAALGEEQADLLLKNAMLLNVFSGEVHPADIAIREGQVVGFGDYPARGTIDLAGKVVCPGLIDAHVHLEDSMVPPAEFARVVVPRGTTSVICDPHEIANVLGLNGIRYMLEASADLPLNVYLMAPSCVPATDMETAGAALSADDIREVLGWERVLGLAEMMNYPGVLARVPEVLDRLHVAAGRPIDGHAPGLAGRDLNAYIAAGIHSDHECTELEEAREKLRRGLRIFIREGAVARNLEALLPLVTPANARYCSFCTDDRDPDTLLTSGGVDDVVRSAMARGLDPVLAVQMASINTARHFRLQGIGAVAPGYRADLLVLGDLHELQVDMVFSAGKLVAREGQYLRSRKTVRHPGNSVRVNLSALDFSIPASDGPARVIGVIPDQVVTESLVMEPTVAAGQVVADPARDLLKIAVVERHQGSGNVGLGLVQGMGLERGAMASSVAHDSHNIVVVGVSDGDMHAAVAAIADLGGGQVVVEDGQTRAAVALPIAGLMSDRPLEHVRDSVRGLGEAAKALGCTLSEPFMTLSFLALPVIPALKLTDQGLVDVSQFGFVPLLGEP
jgi:adenine deaminase